VVIAGAWYAYVPPTNPAPGADSVAATEFTDDEAVVEAMETLLARGEDLSAFTTDTSPVDTDLWLAGLSYADLVSGIASGATMYNGFADAVAGNSVYGIVDELEGEAVDTFQDLFEAYATQGDWS